MVGSRVTVLFALVLACFHGRAPAGEWLDHLEDRAVETPPLFHSSEELEHTTLHKAGHLAFPHDPSAATRRPFRAVAGSPRVLPRRSFPRLARKESLQGAASSSTSEGSTEIREINFKDCEDCEDIPETASQFTGPVASSTSLFKDVELRPVSGGRYDGDPVRSEQVFGDDGVHVVFVIRRPG
jgi:hypothetical protein